MSRFSDIKLSDKKLLLVCLVISAILWFFTALTENYEHQLVCELEYVNLPTDLVPVYPLLDEMQVYLTGNGFDLLRYSQKSKRKIQIDYHFWEAKEPILYEEIVEVVSHQLHHFRIDNLRPNTLPFSFQERHAKTVPLRLKKKISTNQTWFLADSVRLIPDSVLLSGPKELVDSIDSWPTNLLKLEKLENNVSGTVDLMSSKAFNLSIEPNKVNYEVKVDQWTEKTMTLPIESLNLPDSLLVFLFPKKANLKFQVPFSQYELLNEGQFSIVADFEKMAISKVAKNNKINLQLQTQESHIRNIRIEPSAVEFVVSLKDSGL